MHANYNNTKKFSIAHSWSPTLYQCDNDTYMYNHVHELCMYVCNTSLLAHVNSQSALMWSKAVIHIPILVWAVSIGGALCSQQYMKKMTKKRIKCCMFFWPQLQICPIFFISKCIIIHLTFLLFFFTVIWCLDPGSSCDITIICIAASSVVFCYLS